jgi:pantothenate kinase
LSTFDDPLLALQKRGAPFTFDSAAFLKLILQLYTMPVTAPGDHEVIIRAPSFDHAKQDPIADDIEISSMNIIVIIEGNYTLLNEAPWDAISSVVHDRLV